MLILKMKSRVTNVDFVRTLIILLGLSFVWASSSSIGSEFESSLSCSKFDFEEKVLEKLVRLEHKMQILEEKMDVRDKLNTAKLDEIGNIMEAREKLNTAKLDEIGNIMEAREKLNTAKLDEINNIKKRTETFLQSIQDAQIQDQTRFNKSYQETVEHFKTQTDNETEIYGNQMNALLESISSKIDVFAEAEKKMESVEQSMQLSFDKEQRRFNSSYAQIVENFKVNSNKRLQEIISNIQTVVVTGCTVGSGIVSVGSLKFPNIKTSMGVSDLSSFKSTGKFTCQVPGYYFIAVTIMSYHVNTRIDIMRNSTAIHWQYVTGYTKDRFYWTPGAAAVALELKSDDNVWIKLIYSKSIEQSCLTIFKIN